MKSNILYIHLHTQFLPCTTKIYRLLFKSRNVVIVYYFIFLLIYFTVIKDCIEIIQIQKINKFNIYLYMFYVDNFIEKRLSHFSRFRCFFGGTTFHASSDLIYWHTPFQAHIFFEFLAYSSWNIRSNISWIFLIFMIIRASVKKWDEMHAAQVKNTVFGRFSFSLSNISNIQHLSLSFFAIVLLCIIMSVKVNFKIRLVDGKWMIRGK